jgi:hypothetical protein
VHTRLRAGNPAQETLKELREGQYDLLILGERRSGRAAHYWSRTPANLWLVEHCPCPVLVVKGQVGPVRRVLLCDSGSENSVLSRFVLQMAEMLTGGGCDGAA